MKNMNKFLSLMAIVLFGTLTSCVQDDDFDTPPLAVNDMELETNTTLSALKQMYASTNSLVAFTDDNAGLVVSGYVVSNDEAGNFYKTLIIQDAPENPTAALQIDVDVTSLFSFYKPGQKIYVKLDGLGLDNVNGVLHIGNLIDGGIERISAVNYQNFIVRSAERATMVPKVITPADYDDSLINILVQIENMQVRSSDVGLGYGNLDNTFSVNRYLKNCDDDSETVLRNSGFADFKNHIMPEGNGTITAVFSKYNSTFQLFIRDTEDVNFDGVRCDPLFEDTFASNNFDNWTTYSVTGDEAWEVVDFGNPAPSAKMSGFNSGAQENEDWLISNAIDLSAVSNATLNFQSVKRYGGPDLEVYFSTDYAGGNPVTDGTWTLLSATLDTDEGSWSSWTDSGNIDVSAAAGGNLFVAFKYVSDSSSAATFEIDNVEVFGN